MTLDEAIAHAHAAKSNDINSLSGRALAVLVDAFDAKLATQANFISMPRNLTEAMKEVITNEHEIFQSAQDLYDALLKLATTTQSVADNFQEQIRPRVHSTQEFAMDNYNVRLTAFQARMARKIGEGNLSDGIRYSIEFVLQNGGKKNDSSS